MSFLKDFKDDLAQAVNELVSDEDIETTDKKDNKDFKKQKNKKYDGNDNKSNDSSADVMNDSMDTLDLNKVNSMLDAIDEEIAAGDISVDEKEADKEADKKTVETTEAAAEENADTMTQLTFADEMTRLMNEEGIAEEEKVDTEVKEKLDNDMVDTIGEVASDEVTEITKGTVITGNISSTGSMNIYGSITGDISCKGKMIITGTVKGTAEAKEIFANNAKIEGDIKSDGTIKIGNGTVVVGNVFATSAVIGGAIKGDIDVNGPVIVDSTAIVKGNIKSKSVQINNGAVIDGFCSQAYAEIDYKSLFEDTFATK